jgi:MscS family membrane protein
MDPDFPPRVHFTEFASDAFEIRFMFWYAPPDHWAFQAFSEQVNLEIFRAFEQRGIQFSLPVRHSYWKQDDRQGPLEIELNNITAESDRPQTTPPSE